MSTTTKKLFIVESPNKTATVRKYLGPGWDVTASVGHTYMLPKKDYVDVSKDFKLNFEPDPKKRDVLKNIEKMAQQCDEIYLGTDFDIEGSCIAWHLYQHLQKKLKGKKTYIRVNLKEITKTGIQQALAASYPMTDPREFNIVQAGFVRRIEDRFVGFKLSPLAFAYVQKGTSAGRVQSPALRIVTEREREIENFKPEVYYEIFAELFPQNTTSVFTAKYAPEVTDEKIASLVVSQCKNKEAKITKVTKKQTESKPGAPFITKTLLQAASTILNWKTKQATKVAQMLFNAGVITYPRCDNTVISGDGQLMLADYIKANFTAAYIPSKIPDYNNKKAKLEHECIRPTDLVNFPKLMGDELKLYELIRSRFLAAGLTAAKYDSTSVEIKIGQHLFKAQGSVQTFDGYLKVWTYGNRTDSTLPNIDATTSLVLRDVFSERKETKPPARYKGASLIEALDKMSIGKPSTMDSILGLLESREYIRYEKQAIVPTELGKRLNDFLVKYFLNVIDFEFTARVEEEQDKVASGELQYKDVVSGFYSHLKAELKQASLVISGDKTDLESTTISCPVCKENLLLKKLNRKQGTHFYACSGYQDKSCKASFSIGEDGLPSLEKKQVESLKPCPREGCGGELLKRVNGKTQEVFYACSNWKEKDCKVSANAQGETKTAVEQKKHGKCEKCKKGFMVERRSRVGIFLGCNNFPRCRNARPLEEKKEEK